MEIDLQNEVYFHNFFKQFCYCIVLYCIDGVVIAALMHCDLLTPIVLPRMYY